MTEEALVNDLAVLIARHDVDGRTFVAACLRAAEGYYEASELPTLVDAGELAEALREAFATETAWRTH